MALLFTFLNTAHNACGGQQSTHVHSSTTSTSTPRRAAWRRPRSHQSPTCPFSSLLWVAKRCSKQLPRQSTRKRHTTTVRFARVSVHPNVLAHLLSCCSASCVLTHASGPTGSLPRSTRCRACAVAVARAFANDQKNHHKCTSGYQRTQASTHRCGVELRTPKMSLVCRARARGTTVGAGFGAATMPCEEAPRFDSPSAPPSALILTATFGGALAAFFAAAFKGAIFNKRSTFAQLTRPEALTSRAAKMSPITFAGTMTPASWIDRTKLRTVMSLRASFRELSWYRQFLFTLVITRTMVAR